MSEDLKGLSIPDLWPLAIKYGPVFVQFVQDLYAALNSKQQPVPLFKGKSVGCDDDCAVCCECLCEQRKAILETLVHNIHMAKQCGG